MQSDTARSGGAQVFNMPRLATVTITGSGLSSIVKITLDPRYVGDLNDLEQHNGLPAGVYLECDALKAVNNPLLAKFMEVLSQWDHNHDGVYDGDALSTAIDNALPLTNDTPNAFHRPDKGWYTGMLMKLMPPAPTRHIVYSFGELKERFRVWHYIVGLPAIVIILGMIQLQIQYLPFMRYTVITGASAIVAALGLPPLVVGILFGLVVYLILFQSKRSKTPSSFSPHTFGFFNKAAVYEEQAFREGSENWSFSQRLTSCLIFGAVHMTNLIYPLATILPLSIGGAIFMYAYLHNYRRTKFRRSAVLASALVHRVYNRLALVAFTISLVVIFGKLALVFLGIGAALAYATNHWIADKSTPVSTDTPSN